MMETIVILILAGAGLHLTVLAQTAGTISGGRYSKPVVYSNLPPPVLYYPNFSEQPKIAERGDEDSKRVEFVPFPFKELPLLVYQSDNQPPVHVVQQQQNVGTEQAPQGKEQPQQGSATIYMQGNGQQYQSVQMYPAPQGNSNPVANVAAPDSFPDLQNHQFISIGLSAIQDVLGNSVFAEPRPASDSASQYQQAQNSQSYGPQNGNQYGQQQPASYQGQNEQNQGQQQYAPTQNGGQQYSQQYPVPSNQLPSNSFQNSNNQAMLQTQQNTVPQYSPAVSIQYQRQAQYPQQNTESQVQQGTNKNNQAQLQYSTNAQQTKSNSQELAPSAIQKLFYQHSNDLNQNLNSIQNLGISISTIQSPAFSNQQQSENNDAENQNLYQQAQQYQQSQDQSQIQSGAEEEAVENEPQYISISVYPYGGHQSQEPEQFYRIPIPAPNDEDEEEEEEEDDEEEEDEIDDDSKEVDTGMPQQIQEQNQAQGLRYRGQQGAENSKQRRPNIGNYNQKRPNNNFKQQRPMNTNQQRPMNTNQKPTNMNTNQRKPNNLNNNQRQPNNMNNNQRQPYNMNNKQRQLNNLNNKQRQPNNMNNNQRKPNNVNVNQQNSNNMNSYQQKSNNMNSNQQKSNNVNSNRQRPSINNSNQQRPPNKFNSVNINKQQNIRDPLPKQAQTPEGPSEDPEYQQILIHIPHPVAAAPQILIQPGDGDQSPVPYMGTAQGNDQMKPTPTNNLRKPQYASSNNEFSMNYLPLNQRYVRPKILQRYPPIEYVGAASNIYKRNPFRNPFVSQVSGYKSKPIMPIGSAHPGIYASSNLHYTSLNPLFVPNPLRSVPRVPQPMPFNQVSASMIRPQFLQTPMVSMNAFAPQYPDEMIAQATFPTPGITRTRRGDSNITDTELIDDVSNEFSSKNKPILDDRTILSLAEKSTERLLEKIARDVFAQDVIDGVLASSNINLPNSFNLPRLPDSGGRFPFFPFPRQSFLRYLNVQSQAQDGEKYGNFMKKLAALSSSLISQSIGKKQPVTPQEETKVKHHNNEYTVEEVLDSLLPKNASPRSSNVKNVQEDSIEFSKKTDAKPPIIVYKGPKPPVEVYGSKDDIETTKDDASSQPEAGSRIEDDVDEVNSEGVLDYFDMMYSMLPDFIKHTIGRDNDGSGFSPIDFASALKGGDKSETSSSTYTSKEPTSAFKEDIDELSKLLHKEEKSDIIPF